MASNECDMTQTLRSAPQPELVLQVQAYRNQPLAVALETRFTTAGGTVGRAPGNDLVLEDAGKFISRSHAAIGWRGGVFYLTDCGGNPSIVNDRPLGAGAESAVGDGDRIVIGDYLIVATLETATAPPLPVFEPPAPVPAPALPVFEPPELQERARDVGPTDALAGARILHGGDAGLADPLGLNLFGADKPAMHGAESDHVAPERQLFTLPAAIPAGYDAMADLLPAAPPPQAPPAPPVTVPPASASAVLQALLDGLGLPQLRSSRAPEELAREIGQMLRTATAGTMDVLMARALTKRESHIDLTMIAPRANNPLKFFPDATSALTQMLGTPVPGYLPPLAALDGAFDDLKAHEMAVIAGMRAALAAVVQRFDPERIEQRLTEPGRIERLLAGSRKARLWDRLVESYGELARDADEDLQRLFGEKFSVAYEQQVERLRSGRAIQPEP